MPTKTAGHRLGPPGNGARASPGAARRKKRAGAIAAGGVALAVVAIFGMSAPVAAQSQQDIQELKRQVETLRKKIEKLEAEQARAPAEGIKPGPVKGSFFIPGTNTAIKFGGWAQGDFQVDFDGNPGDLYSTGSIPLQDETGTVRSNESTRLAARNTRFNFTSLTPTGFGTAKGFFEFDFRGTEGTETISNSHQVRLRHAYAEFPVGKSGKLLVGQTWSNAFSLGTSAPAVSWVGSEGGLFVRQAQIRYTHDLGGGTDFRLSVENPETRIGGAPTDSGATRGALNDLYPDIIGKFTSGGSWGRADVALINQFPRIDRGGVDEIEYAWALTANVGYKVTPNDTLYLQTSGGQGLGRYLNASFLSGFLVSGDIELSDQYGFRAGFGHKVNKNLSINVFGGLERNDSPSGFTGDPNRTLWSIHGNVFYRPFPELAPNLWLALEYIHGDRETESGREGQAERIHFATRYNF